MASGGSNLSANFKNFATKASGKECTSKDCTRWFKDCVGFGKCMTSNSLDIAYSAVKKTKPGLTIDMMPDLIARMAKDYAKDKKCTEDDAKTQLREKLASGGKQSHGTTKTANKSTTDKMTDASKYTGAHKERFGADGKGKGLDGREDKADNSGYVGNYKGADTFDKKTTK